MPALPKASSLAEHRSQQGAQRCPEPVSQDGSRWDCAGRVQPVKPVSPLQARYDFSTACSWVVSVGRLKSSVNGWRWAFLAR